VNRKDLDTLSVEEKRLLLTQLLQQDEEEPEELPLSYAQQRMWFLDQWKPDSASYSIPGAWKIHGALDVAALRASLQAIVQRHEAFRTRFRANGDEPVQVIDPTAAVELPIVDLSGMVDPEREIEMLRILQAEAERPFDLANGPLMRSLLIKFDPETHVWFRNVHHIVYDGWSSDVFFRELKALYQAFVQGTTIEFPELPLQYADFACWQREQFQNGDLQKQFQYWRKKLAGAPKMLELPTDYLRPVTLSEQGVSYNFDFKEGLADKIRESARTTKTTPFMIMLAAYQVRLWRYTGQDDIVVATPIAGRNRPELEDIIGCFINTLALRTNLSGDPTVAELLDQVRITTLEAYAYQDLPFEKLVEELHLERSINHHPLFQVMFNYHNMPRQAVDLFALDIEGIEVSSGAAKFDLNLAIGEDSAGLHGMITYSTDLFRAETVQRFIEYYQTLLEALATGPGLHISQLPLLTTAERTELIASWNATDRPYPDVRCLHELFEDQVDCTPDAWAVVFGNDHYTYRELNERANQVAHYLKSLGIAPEVRVGLYMDKSLDVLVALLGILKAGGAYIPLDPLYPNKRIHFMLSDVNAPVLITVAELAAELPPLDNIHVVRLDSDWPTIARHSSENPPHVCTPDNLMYVLFTSGSTGLPKGVAVQHGNYFNYLQGVLPKIQARPGMHYAMVSTFAADLGAVQFWAPLTTGGAAHLVAHECATDPEALADYFQRYPIDVLKIVPSHYDALQSVPAADRIVPRHLTIFAGEANHWQTVARARALCPNGLVQDHYGPTETTSAALVYEILGALPQDATTPFPLGAPLDNVRIYTLDDHLEPTPPGIAGELCIGGLGVTRGYVGRPGLTAERFVPDPFSTMSGARMYRTGDLGCFALDGSLQFLGRKDFQIKIRGYRIEAGEIEMVLREQPAIHEAVVIAREDTPGDRRLVAYVVLHPQCAGVLETGALRDVLRERLPDYMTPTAFVVLDAIPLNPNGKVDRQQLPVPEYTRLESGREFVAPRNDAEELVAAVWRETLGIEAVSIDDNFFDLGGESFKAIRVVRKIGHGVSVMDLFKKPTVRELAALLADESSRESGILYELTKPIPARQKELSLICVPYGGGSGIVFRPLAEALPNAISLYAVQIPAHDFSHKEQVLQPLREVARQCVAEAKRTITGPVAVYGHCVGSALAVEITRQLELAGVEVIGLFLAGTFPIPRLPGRIFEWFHKLFPTNRFTASRNIYEGLRALGGFTDDMEADEKEFVINSLRHDVVEAEDYYTAMYAKDAPAKLQAPIVCVVGERDRVTELYQERFHEWEHFSDQVELAVVPQAGHYFLKHQAQALAGIITQYRAVWQGEKRPESQSKAEAVLTKVMPRPKSAPSLRTFFIIAIGQLISLIGTGLTAFGLGIWVYQKTGSLVSFSLIQVCAFLPGILALPVSGALADRWDKRKLMILSDTLAACCTFSLMLLLRSDALQLWHIAVICGVASLANAFQRPAYAAAITQLVPKQYLGHANGIVQLGGAVGDLVSSILGGALLLFIGLNGIVIIDLATFLIAVTTLLLVRFPNTLFFKREESFLKEMSGGWRYTIKRPEMRAMVLSFMAANYFVSLVTVMITPFGVSFTNATVLGAVLAANGAGVLVGSIVMSVWGGTRRRAKGMIGFGALYGASVLLMSMRPQPVLFGVGLFCMGMALALINAHWMALIQTKVGLELQGRVIAMNQMVSWAMVPIGFVTSGPLVQYGVGPLLAGKFGQLIGADAGNALSFTMVVAGIVIALLAVVGYRYKTLRLMDDTLPDAIPDAVIIGDKDDLQSAIDQHLQLIAK